MGMGGRVGGGIGKTNEIGKTRKTDKINKVSRKKRPRRTTHKLVREGACDKRGRTRIAHGKVFGGGQGAGT